VSGAKQGGQPGRQRAELDACQPLNVGHALRHALSPQRELKR